MLIRIMACKEREDNIKKMLSSLGDGVEVIRDTDHNPCHTLQRVLDSDEPMLVMEDDIELCKDFLKKAKKEIKEHSDSFVMFYSCTGGEELELINKLRWEPYSRTFVYTQAYYVPAWIWKKLSKFLETNEHANNHRWSKWINEFLVQEWINRYLVIPSLVQHIWVDSINEPNRWPTHQSRTYNRNI